MRLLSLKILSLLIVASACQNRDRGNSDKHYSLPNQVKDVFGPSSNRELSLKGLNGNMYVFQESTVQQTDIDKDEKFSEIYTKDHLNYEANHFDTSALGPNNIPLDTGYKLSLEMYGSPHGNTSLVRARVFKAEYFPALGYHQIVSGSGLLSEIDMTTAVKQIRLSNGVSTQAFIYQAPTPDSVNRIIITNLVVAKGYGLIEYSGFVRDSTKGEPRSFSFKRVI